MEFESIQELFCRSVDRFVQAIGTPHEDVWDEKIWNPEVRVDGVFATIQDAVSSGADAINVSYDPNAGFPLTVAIDYELQAADEELAITISDFRSELAHAGQGISCGGR